MSEIRLTDSKINYNGEWLSVDDLTQKIQNKIKDGDMNVANLAIALEQLNKAVKHSKKIEVTLVLSKDQYDKLKKLGGQDDAESIIKAVMAYVDGKPGKSDSSEEIMEISEPEVEISEPDNAQTPATAESTKSNPSSESDEKKKTVIKCSKCKNPIEIPPGEKPKKIRCPNCGAKGRLKSSQEDKRYKDHYLE